MISAIVSFIFGCTRTTTTDMGYTRSISEEGIMSEDNFTKGKDFLIYKRARISDTINFTQPVEAFSFLIPEDWRYEGSVVWNGPCDGSGQRFRAYSPDREYEFILIPDYKWHHSEKQSKLSGCAYGEAMPAWEHVENILSKGVE